VKIPPPAIIRALLIERDISLRELAASLGVDYGSLSNTISGSARGQPIRDQVEAYFGRKIWPRTPARTRRAKRTAPTPLQPRPATAPAASGHTENHNHHD